MMLEHDQEKRKPVFRKAGARRFAGSIMLKQKDKRL
jgi:hypothetical protein